MFCSGCGISCIPNAKFCHQCGKEITDHQDTSGTSSGSGTSAENANRGKGLTSFQSFRARKEGERSKFFKTCGTKAKKSKLEDKQPEEVKINIGVMILKDGKLSIKRGATLPLTVAPSIGSKELLTKAVEKHTRFNQNLVDRAIIYRLLYADYEEVTTIPGTEDPFTLKKYKEEIDKPYTRITFFLCSSEDLFESRFGGDGESSDGELYRSSMYNTPQNLNRGIKEGSQSVQNVSVIDVDEECAQNTSVVSSETAGSSNCSGSDERKPQHTQCPICLESYPLCEIETHASSCRMWMLEEEDFSYDSSEPNDELTVEREIPPSVTPKQVLMEEVSHVAEAVLSDETKRLTVRRKFLWQDFKNARKKKIGPKDRVKVVFSGEPAVDDGGPRRELFSELISFIQRKFFCNGKPIQSTLALTSGDFNLCGEIMGMSILQGGPAPNFMAPNIATYLTGGILRTEDNQNQGYQTLCESLLNATSDTDVQRIVSSESSLELLQELGYTGIPQRETLQTSKGLIQSLCIKDQLEEYLPQVLQIETGLSQCGLTTPIRNNSKIWQPVFESGNMFMLSAEEILDQSIVEFSESQLKKEAESDTYKYFCDVLEAIDNGAIEDLQITHFTKWLTGTSQLPVLGFPKKFGIKFVHGCQEGCKCRPTVSTCDITMKIPVHINSEEIMTDMLYSAVGDSYGFGNL